MVPRAGVEPHLLSGNKFKSAASAIPPPGICQLNLTFSIIIHVSVDYFPRPKRPDHVERNVILSSPLVMVTPVLAVLGVVRRPGVWLVLSLHIPADCKHHDGAS